MARQIACIYSPFGQIQNVFLGLPNSHIRSAETSDVLIGLQELPYPSAKNRSQEDIGIKQQPLRESFTPASPPPLKIRNDFLFGDTLRLQHFLQTRGSFL